MGINAALAIVKGLVEQGNFGQGGRNETLHDYFVQGIQKVGEKYPGSIAGPYGLGGMVALTPFDGTPEVASEMAKRLFDAGLMSFMAGGDPARLRFLMPIGCVTHDQLDLACQILEQVVGEMAAARPA